jgi:hypothetical protein
MTLCFKCHPNDSNKPNSKSIAWEFVIKPCPWCKKTPRLSISYHEHCGGTWLWYVICQSYDCPIKPKGREIGVRNTSKTSLERQYNKIIDIIYEWNCSNPIPPYEKTIFYPLVR